MDDKGLNNLKKFNRYKHYSEQAAKAEQEQRWADAVELWSLAELNTLKAANKEWCENRKAFCERMVMKPFN